jgi:predicted acetyltransferase
MITYLKDRYIPDLKEMWRLSFSDTPEFMALYFSKICKAEETLILVERDVLVASLQMMPYRLKLKDTTVNACYIFGAMTHPKFRGNRYMEKLLLYAFDLMQKTGVAVTFLIPQEESLVEYYAKYGFVPAFPRFAQELKVPKDMILETKAHLLPSGVDISYLYASLLEEKTNVMLKTEQQIKYALEDTMLSEGSVYVCTSGIAFVYYKNKQVIIKELLVENARAKHTLLNTISEKYQVDKVTIYCYAPHKKAYMAGMIKLIDESLTLPDDIYMSLTFD